MGGASCSSTGNLNHHLKVHLDKIDPFIEKQATFMKNFLSSSDENKKKPVIIYIYLYLLF
jgi:hypothetical protein